MKLAMPTELSTELTSAIGLISEDGELPAIARKRIFQLIGDLSAAEHPDAGYLRRARLALICAGKVLICLQPYSDVQAAATTMLENGIAALSGKDDLTLLQKDNGNFHTKVIDLFEYGETAYVSVYAGMACFAAINTVLFDTNFDLVGEDEKEVPPDDWDASYYGSLAVSGSAIWEGKGGANERQFYWHWYLNHALPLAWNVLVPLKAIFAQKGKVSGEVS